VHSNDRKTTRTRRQLSPWTPGVINKEDSEESEHGACGNFLSSQNSLTVRALSNRDRIRFEGPASTEDWDPSATENACAEVARPW